MTEEEKIEYLKAAGNAQVAQIVKIGWGEPDGDKFYSTTAVSDLVPFRAAPLRPVEPKLLGKDFLPFELSPDLSDEEIGLNFEDFDLEIQRLFFEHGEGTRVEIFYYYPEVDYLVSRWFGQLSPPENNSYASFQAKAASGFASRLMLLPRRAFYELCAALFGFYLKTQDEIDHNDCPYNRHIGGDVGNLDGEGQPFTSCPKTTAACVERLGDAQSHLGFNVTASAIVTDNRGNYAASRGNASNLKRPLRVVIGHKIIRDLDLLTWRREPNVSTPDHGFVAAIWAVCEGSVEAIFDLRVNDGATNVQAVNYRYGEKRQTVTSYGGGISNFSGTAHVFARLGWVNANQTDATSLKTQIVVHGLNTIRVYSDSETFTTQHTNNRVWGLLECYANRRWGRGYDYARFHLADWKLAADTCDETINYIDPNGITRQHRRTQLDVDLQGRVTHEQIIDICRSGRLSVPFQHNGKYTIKALIAASDLESVPVFTDVGDSRNIVRNGNLPAINYSIQSDRTIPNEIKLVFEDSANADIERPLTFIDEEQQLKAGRTFGDTSLRPIQKSYVAFGVRTENEAIKLGWTLLHLGEFDTGGLRNNLRVVFTTWHTQVLDLMRYDVIKIVSPLIERFGFQYFRILNLRQQSNLLVEVTAQAYPEEYYAAMEGEAAEEPLPPTEVILPPQPRRPIIEDVGYNNGFLNIQVGNVV